MSRRDEVVKILHRYEHESNFVMNEAEFQANIENRADEILALFSEAEPSKSKWNPAEDDS